MGLGLRIALTILSCSYPWQLQVCVVDSANTMASRVPRPDRSPGPSPPPLAAVPPKATGEPRAPSTAPPCRLELFPVFSPTLLFPSSSLRSLPADLLLRCTGPRPGHTTISPHARSPELFMTILSAGSSHLWRITPSFSDLFLSCLPIAPAQKNPKPQEPPSWSPPGCGALMKKITPACG